MDFYLVWPSLVVTIVIVALASTPFLLSADLAPTAVAARVPTIDGLRGFLALGVFFHHTAIYHQYLLTGTWALPPSRFYANMGQGGVAMFFMITGYLFWMQMLKAKGRPDLLRLCIGRVFRIVPLYLLLAFIVLLSVGVLTGWHLEEPPFALVKDVSKWLTGGMVVVGDVNGYATSVISAGVTWSLRYEWWFYASLFVTSLFARQRILGAMLPVMGLLITTPLLLLHPDDLFLAVVLTFSVGMTAASARHTIVTEPLKTPQFLASAAVVGCLALVLFGFDGVRNAFSVVILGVAFGLIVSGATIFGLLLTRPARRLGDISYGIYLLQGPILFAAFASSFVRSSVISSAWNHWAIVMAAAVALVMLATVAHGLIEQPAIVAGQWASARFVSRRRRSGGAAGGL